MKNIDRAKKAIQKNHKNNKHNSLKNAIKAIKKISKSPTLSNEDQRLMDSLKTLSEKMELTSSSYGSISISPSVSPEEEEDFNS